MGAVQFIQTDAGEELAILSRAEYELLLARAGDPAAEDLAATAIVTRSNEDLARGADVAMPEEVWEAIEGGTHPVAAIRQWRRMTQVQLAKASGVSQGFLSELEQGQKTISISTTQKLGRALDVPWSVLAPDQKR
ncbi:MAG: helix-turn-helix transcriptional regulator [Phenylobacterium sp.]|uniref:helix-turn-helix domain-containing protein n=1 Tax=Phenylobacterium sp. TaxID=1871053 RepID=UPI002722B10F|nr:helix-turn-helix transcriptional regulator [Phenylobacterium sp.]MDO8409815.1 helix-turn-helix transcriptional regulator [Phenylobacterium sp.]